MPRRPPRVLNFSGRTRLAAVIGSPVHHSLSPAIHNAAFTAAGLDWVYVALEVPAGKAGAAVEALRALDIVGLSVTMPHKDDVAGAVDRWTEEAEILGAVNCVYRDGDELVGDNTDGIGFVDGLRLDHGIDPAGRRCVVLGAGGAARSVIRALGGAGAAEVVVVNRSADRAEAAMLLAGPVGRVGSLDDVTDAELLVNATSVGMGEDHRMPVPPESLSSRQVVADLVVHPVRTPLLTAAEARGARTVEGVSMLVHQAAHAYRRWTGEPAPLEAMRRAVGLPGQGSMPVC